MYRLVFPLLTYFSLSLFLFFTFIPTTWGAILITKIQVEGGTNEADNEYIEVTNTENDTVPTNGLALVKYHKTPTLCDKGGMISPDTTTHFPAEFKPKETIFLKYEKASATSTFFTLLYKNKLTGNDTLILSDKTIPVIDKVSYGNSCNSSSSPAIQPGKNQQLVRKQNADGKWQDTGNNADDFEIFPPIIITPPTVPPTTDPTTPLPTNNATTVRFNEILPNPTGDEATGEYIELFNFGAGAINLKNWTLRDASKTGHYTFPNDTLIEPNEFFILYRSTFTFALNNSNETVSLIDPNSTLVDTVHYGTSTENVSYNFSPSGWRWSQFTTPGAPNRLNTLPTAKTSIPTEGYVNTAIKFSARGSDTDHDTLKYVWDFGDGHKSYKAVTTHTYAKTKKYTVTLTIKDKSETTVKTKRITIGKYPKSKIRIVSLTPNPKGSDTDHETIVLQNLSKKTVRLKNWKIATKSTGTKSFVNHTILSTIILKPKKTVTLTSADSRFTLNNGSSQIALRLPDGRTLQTVRYTAPTKTAKDDDRYVRLASRQWAWIPGGVSGASSSPLKSSTISSNLAEKNTNTEPLATATTNINVSTDLDLKDVNISTQKSLNSEIVIPLGSMSQKENSVAMLPLQPLVLGAYTVNLPVPLTATPSSFAILSSKNPLAFLFEALNAWLQKFF